MQRDVFDAPGFRQARTIFGSFLRLPMVTTAEEPTAFALVTRTSIRVPLLSLRLRPKSDVSDFLPFLTFL